MGEVVRFPVDYWTPARLNRAESDLREELERQRHTVQLAFAAVAAGRLDDEAVHAVIARRAGDLDDYVALQEQIKLAGRVLRACGYQPVPRCSCTTRCPSWPHCAGGPEGI